MKVIGGPHDGRDVMADHIGPYGYLRLADPIPEISIQEHLCSEVGRISPVRITYTEYTVRRLASGRIDNPDIFEFLAPRDWTDMQALRHQFSK